VISVYLSSESMSNPSISKRHARTRGNLLERGSQQGGTPKGMGFNESGPENLLGRAFGHGEVVVLQTKGIMQSDRRIRSSIVVQRRSDKTTPPSCVNRLECNLIGNFFHAALPSRGTVGIVQVVRRASRLSIGTPYLSTQASTAFSRASTRFNALEAA
jgi:hypothetical protein